MRVALAQMDILWEDKEKNKEKVLTFLSESKKQQADLVLFPEMTLTGFSMNVPKIGELPDDSSGTLAWFQSKSTELDLNIGFGYVEFSCNTIKGFNKFSVVSPKDGIISSYSKIHPFSFGLESQHYIGGNSLSSFHKKNFNISTFICYDLRFPEVFQAASKNSTFIIVIANWPEARREHWITLLKARAIENQCYIAGINRVGLGDNISYCGDSLIINPYGNILCHNKGQEILLVQDIDISEVINLRNSFKLKSDRRENLYKTLY